MITYCFTGHRPNKLGGYDWKSEKNQKILKALKSKIIELINNAPTEEKHFKFICGGALGIDQMAFEICKIIKENTLKLNPCKIELILAMPFEKQDNNWFKQTDKDRLNSQKIYADEVVLVDTLENYKFDKVNIGEYHPAKMQLRNMYMVDNADEVIAVWDGSKGGTGNCVEYARKQGKIIHIINPNKLKN